MAPRPWGCRLPDSACGYGGTYAAATGTNSTQGQQKQLEQQQQKQGANQTQRTYITKRRNIQHIHSKHTGAHTEYIYIYVHKHTYIHTSMYVHKCSHVHMYTLTY